MLTIKKPLFHLGLPELTAKSMQLSPVVSDGDELLEAIDNTINDHDDNWRLEPTPDTDELEEGWRRISDDIAHDPEWVWFKDDDESDSSN